DTNVLLHNPKAIESFPNHNVNIPIEVIEEIDKFKRNVTELGRNSRTVAQLLDTFRRRGRLGEGVELDNGSLLRIICEPVDEEVRELGLRASNRVDNRILSLAAHMKKQAAESEPVIVTKNVNLRLKADSIGVTAEDYETEYSTDADEYSGWHRLAGDEDTVRQLKEGTAVNIDAAGYLVNEYIYLFSDSEPENTAENEEDAKLSAIGRIEDAGEGRVVPLADYDEGAVGIFPLNLEQRFTLDALLDDRIQLVTMTGKAGTGKTLLAVAAGLRKVFKEDMYNRLLIFRPTTPVGKDIGFLPGAIEEKMRPWMQPVYDALELIREEDRRSRHRSLPPDIMDCEEISIEPLTYIRGRSIPRQYIIIDEAQNLTPLEVKTVITRVGQGTKLVLTGDPHQIDNPYVDALSNGLVFLVDRFRENKLAAHVGLVKGERSELAETAANTL
ncbi:MAG: PhoH family protein, partial [Verrucomicrobiota bacterium]